jgi:hypothetical protein
MSRSVRLNVDGRDFIFKPRGRSFRESLPFDWESLDPALPPLRGAIALHRLGPIVLLRIDVSYRIASDLPGRLLKESVGAKGCVRSLRSLRRGLQHILTNAPPPARRVTSAP